MEINLYRRRLSTSEEIIVLVSPDSDDEITELTAWVNDDDIPATTV